MGGKTTGGLGYGSSGRINGGARGGLAHLKDLAAPAKHLF